MPETFDTKSLVTEGFYRVESPRFQCRIQTRQQPYNCTDDNTVDHPVPGYDEAGIEYDGKQISNEYPKEDSEDRTKCADDHRLHQKLPAHHLTLASYRLDQAHFFRPLRDGNQHDIH